MFFSIQLFNDAHMTLMSLKNGDKSGALDFPDKQGHEIGHEIIKKKLNFCDIITNDSFC